MVAQTVETFGRLDIAVNNAGKEIAGPTLDLPSSDFDELIATNLKGTYFCMKHEVAQMRKSGGGAIVNQASVTSSLTGVPDNGLYGATKGGIIGLTKSAALQVAAENISINAIASCAFDIPDDVFLRWLEDHEITREQAAGWLPIRRLGRPEEIAAATLYLAVRRGPLRGRRSPGDRRRLHRPITTAGIGSRSSAPHSRGILRCGTPPSTRLARPA